MANIFINRNYISPSDRNFNYPSPSIESHDDPLDTVILRDADSNSSYFPFTEMYPIIECRSALEWILTAVSAEHAKSWTESLIDAFGSLANTLAADIHNIIAILDGVTEPAIYLNRFQSTISHIAKCQIRCDPVYSHWERLIEYLKSEMGHLRIEQIRLLLLNSTNCLIDDLVIANGTIREVQCYPRQVARRAVLMNASSAILVHNHPSGDSRMSNADKSITYEVQEACRAVGVRLHDHLVICRDDYSSFRQDNPLWARVG